MKLEEKMATKKPKTYTAEFKAKVALDSIRGDLTINEISSKYGVHDRREYTTRDFRCSFSSNM